MRASSRRAKYEVVIVGGGHNGLVAAAYVAKAGLSTLVLERLPHTGGAAVSAQPFDGLEARLSRYSSLVGLLPQKIISDLDLDLELKPRVTASYTPVVRGGEHTGLLVEGRPGKLTEESFRSLTGTGRDYQAWRTFYGEVAAFAEVVAPTLLSPLMTAREIKSLVKPVMWEALVEQPLGAAIESRFHDDTVRGVVATDALIGTFADTNDPSLIQNRCFLHNLIGNGSSAWSVPVGGMGAVTDALAAAAIDAGAKIVTGAAVSRVSSDGTTAEVSFHDGEKSHAVQAEWVLSNVAPWVLQGLLREEQGEPPAGAQLQINFLLERLPRLRSGANPLVAFAGTFHVAEDYSQLQTAYDEAVAGKIPFTPPGELYCHSLTDPSILGDLAGQGAHTLTYFGLHMPARVFEGDPEAKRDEAVERVLDSINAHLEEPIENCLALDAAQRLCLEVITPQDLDAALGMPGGHIFHGDLAWPWAANRARLDTPAQRWGVSTDVPNVMLCGAGARRGGAVSGIGGHNAAYAVMDSVRDHLAARAQRSGLSRLRPRSAPQT